MKSFGEFVQQYEKKTKEKFKVHENLCIEYCPENGILTYLIDESEKQLILFQVCGNAEYWDIITQKIAKMNGCNKITFATKRNPKGFIRKYRYKVAGYVLEKDVG